MHHFRYVVFLGLILLLAACGRQLSEEDTVVSAPATSVPATTVQDESATEEATTEGVAVAEDPLAAAINAADPATGETLFNQITSTGFACVNCHNPNSTERLVGPGLLNVAIRAADRVEGESFYEYLHNSIVNPNAYVVAEYPENLMPQVYTEVFTEDQINDLVAYLLTLRDQPLPSADTAVVEGEATEEATVAEGETTAEAGAEVAQEATTAPTEAPPTATPLPTSTPFPTRAVMPTANPTAEVVLTLEGQGNAAIGEFTFNSELVDDTSCADCHSVDTSERTEDNVGLLGIPQIAASLDENPERYIYSAIIDPSLHEGLNYGEVLGPAQLTDLVTYLMTLGSDIQVTSPPPAPTAEPAGDAAEGGSDNEAIIEAVSAADSANGETLFTTINSTGFACSSCHNVASEDRLVGPGLLGIPTRAGERVEGMPPEVYIYHSIVNPNEYVVAEYPENLMPQVYHELFTESEIYDIIAYVMTLGE